MAKRQGNNNNNNNNVASDFKNKIEALEARIKSLETSNTSLEEKVER